MRKTTRELPKYLQIRKNLLDEILSGKLKSGDRIPSENALPKMFDTSKATAVKAVAELVREGYIKKINGKGSFVTGKASVVELKLATFDCDGKLIELFEKQNPGIRIRNIRYDHDNFYDVVEGEGIDVYQLTDYEFRYMATRGYLLDLWENFIKSRKSVFYTEALQLFNCRGYQYAMPYLFSPLIMVHNRSIYAEAGVKLPQANWNWGDLVKIAKKLTLKDERENYYLRYGLTFGHYRNRWPFFILQNGGEIIGRPHGECRLDSPETIGAIRFIADLLFKHRVMPIYFKSTTDKMALKFFHDRKAAMILSSYYHLRLFQQTDFKPAITAPPRGSCPVNALMADAFGVSAKTEYTEAACKFIGFMLSDEAQKLIKKQAIGLPVNRKIAESEEDIPPWIGKEEYFKFKSMLKNSRKIIDVPDPRALAGFWNQLDNVWANIESPAHACRKAAADFYKFVENTNNPLEN